MSYGRDDRGRGGGGGDNSGRRTAAKPSLFVRNVSLRLKADDLYDAFTKFGKIKDIHLPRDYYTGSQRGFGFVEFYDWRDAEDAQYDMDGKNLDGKRLEITFAQSDRRTSNEMRVRDSGRPGRDNWGRDRDRDRSYGGGRDRERDRRGGYRDRSRSRSRTPPRRRRDSRDASNSRSPKRKKYSRSRSPGQDRPRRNDSREPVRRDSREPARRDSREPVRNTRSDSRDRPPNREPQALPPPKSHPEERDEGNKQMNGEEGERFNEGYKSPRRYDATQEMSRSPEVRRDSRSPRRQSRSPIRQSRSPRRQSRSPVRQSRSPIRQSPSPARVSRSPVRQAQSPRRQSRSPVQRSRSPV